MAVAVIVLTILGTLYVARGTVQWLRRDCTLPTSVVAAVIEGEPGTFEYCEATESAEASGSYERSYNPASPSYDDTPVYEPPASTVTTTYAESPAGIAEAEREQAAIDSCYQDYADAWDEWSTAYDRWSTEAWAASDAAWDDYNAGFDAEGNPPGPEPVDPDEDAWRADHPEPVEPDCGALSPPGSDRLWSDNLVDVDCSSGL